jgi:hypothetical protein
MNMEIYIITWKNNCVNKGTILVVNGILYFRYMMAYVMLSGLWCDIVLNVRVPSEDKCKDIKGRHL